MSLIINVVSGFADSFIAQDRNSTKKIGYFDENITVFIKLNSGSIDHNNAVVELNMKYDNGFSVKCPLEEKTLDTSCKYWIWKGQINPNKACRKLIFKAKYRPNVLVKDEVKLQRYQEVGLIDFNGVTLCEDKDNQEDQQNGNNDSLTKLECEYSLNIVSLFRMSMRTVCLKNGKSIACLELSSSKSINSEDVTLAIDDIIIECDNWSFKPVADIKFPLTLKQSIKLSSVYQILTTDNHTMKPITCIISSSINSNIKIKTNWVTNIDLSTTNNTNHHSLHSLSTPLLPSPKRASSITNDKLDFPKYRASKSSPTLRTIKTRSSSHNSITASNNTDKPPTQRHSSLKPKSGSLISLGSGSLNPIVNKRGLKIKVSGPTNVKVGTAFRWGLELLNQSSEKMELIIYVQSSINKDYEKSFPAIPIQSSLKYDPVPLFNNQQLVRNFYQKFNKSGIISLSNHLRVSLESGSIFQTELVLVAFELGLFNLYDLRIVDVASGTLFECGKLLDVLVV